MTRLSARHGLVVLALVGIMASSGNAMADAGSVRFSYEKVEVGEVVEWVLVPKADMTLAGKPTDTTISAAFESLKKDKRSTYLKSSIAVAGKDPAKAKVTVTIDPAAARYALIIMAETVYTLTELGVTGVSFPGFADGALAREDVPFAGYALTVPLWKVVPNTASPSILARMPDGSLEPSEKIVQRWRAKDQALINNIYDYLKAKDPFTVTSVAKSLPALKIPYAGQVSALLKDSRPAVRLAALEVLEGVRDDGAVLEAVVQFMEAEKDDASAAKAAEFLGKAKDKKFSVHQHYFGLTRGDEAVAIASAKALSGFSDPRSAPLLAARLEDARVPVAQASADALEAVKGVPEQKKALENAKIAVPIRLRVAEHLSNQKTDDSRVPGLTFIALNDVEHKAVRAVESLATIRTDSARTAVEALLTSEKRYLRTAAATALISRGDAASLPAFAAASARVKDGPDMEEAAFQIVMKESLNNVLARTKDSNAVLRRLAYRALGDKAQRENAGARAFGTLKDGLSNSDASIRGASARGMGAFADAKAAEALKPLVKDRDANVRRDVALAIGRFKDGQLAPELEALLEDKTPAVQAAALEAIGERGDAFAWKRVVAAIQDKNAEIRASAVTALAKLVSKDDAQGIRDAIGVLSTAVNDSSTTVQIAAIRALGTFNSDQAVTGIAFQLGANDLDVKLAAVQALGSTKHPSAANVVANAGADPERNVRHGVILALGEIKGPDARRALERRAQDEKDAELKELISATLKKL